MNGARPALIVAAPSTDSREALPSPAAVTDAVGDGLKAAGWSREQATDFILDVREGKVPIQDEVPPADPVEWAAVVVTFGQAQATFTAGFEGPFRLAQRGIHEAFPDLDLYVDAVPAPSTDPYPSGSHQ